MADAFAHRGLHGPGIPENTPAAFEAAIARGYGIELDVRLSADGKAVVFHDSTLKRLAGRSERVSSLTAQELSQISLTDSDQTIQPLRAVLETINDRAPVLIELKSDSAMAAELEGAVGSVASAYEGRAAVMSWNVPSMIWMRRFFPEIPRGLVMTSFWGGLSFSANPLLLAAWLMPVVRWSGASFLAHDIRHLPSRRSKWMRKHGMPVVTWTVRTEEQLARARAYADAPVFEGKIERLIAAPATPL